MSTQSHILLRIILTMELMTAEIKQLIQLKLIHLQYMLRLGLTIILKDGLEQNYRLPEHLSRYQRDRMVIEHIQPTLERFALLHSTAMEVVLLIRNRYQMATTYHIQRILQKKVTTSLIGELARLVDRSMISVFLFQLT